MGTHLYFLVGFRVANDSNMPESNPRDVLWKILRVNSELCVDWFASSSYCQLRKPYWRITCVNFLPLF
jgi:hypothetical protein